MGGISSTNRWGRMHIAARALAICVVAALVLASLAGTSVAASSLSNSGGGTWKYQREVSIKENSGTTLTDYQVLVEIKGADFPNEAKSDGADIRFTDSSGSELNYWIESWDYAGKSAKVWVKISNIPAGSITVIRMYYGNPNAGIISNGDKVFDFFDDFNADMLDTVKWIEKGSGSIDISNSILHSIGVKTIYGKADINNIFNKYIEVRGKFKGRFYTDVEVGFGYISSGLGSMELWRGDRIGEWITAMGYDSKTITIADGSGGEDCIQENAGELWDYSNYYNYRIKFENNHVRLWKEDTLIHDISATCKQTSSDLPVLIVFDHSSTSPNDEYIDWVRIRKYTSSEPTITFSPPKSSNSYIYAGIGGLVLILVAIVALKRRSSSKVEESLKREPTVKQEPQKPVPRHKEAVPGIKPTEAPVTETPEIKPAPMTVPEAPGVEVKTAFGYKGASIIYKLKIENNTSDPISDIKVYPYVPDVFLLKEKEKSIALIEPSSSQTVTFEIRPTGECGDCNVSGRVNYYDMASRKRQDIELEQKSLSIICPMLHGKEISETEWYDAVSNLVKTEESTKEIDMPAESLFMMISRVIKDMHMYMQKPETTLNHKLFNGVARFYGEGVKGLRYAAQVEVVGGAKRSKLILKAWAEKEDALTGFYHGILDEIEKRVNVKGYIDDSIVQYNVHIGDRIGTQVKDSVVQRSNIGTGARKCPNCGREVEANEKFCNECGAKL